jgi:hypothetical protein
VINKAGNTSGSQIREASKSQPRKPISGGTISTPLKSFTPLSLEDLFFKQLEKTKSSLNHSHLLKTMPLKKVLPPLNEILLLLGKTAPDPGNADTVQMMKFLNSWIEKYGDLLPDKSRKEIEALKNLLESRNVMREKENKEILFFGNMVKQDNPQWRVSLLREKYQQGEESEDQEQIHCVLDLFCKNLGQIKVVLSSEKRQMFCHFFSTDSQSRHIIRNSLSRFREKLKESGLEPPVFRVKRKKNTEKDLSGHKEKRIGLWV